MRKLHVRAALLATASLQILAAGQAHAQAARRSDNSVETVIVTARRTEERLQDVPISISVVNQEQLNKANITTAQDLARVVPGLNVQSRFSAEQTSFSIRGFSQEQRTSAAVGTYFGEVVAPRGGGLSLPGGDGAGPGSLFDLQNVQVLKGPQGTLFGRNTTGGAVLLVPRKPTDHFEGYVEGSYGNYNMRRLQGVVNLPMTSWARVRLGGDWQKADGWVHNVSGIGPKDYYNTDYVALRGSLVLDLSPSLENYTIVSYLHSHNNGNPGQIYISSGGGALGASVAPAVNRLNASGDPYQVENSISNPKAVTKSIQVINTTTWSATANVKVRNIMSYSHLIQDIRSIVYSSNIQVPSLGAYVSTFYAFQPAGYHTNDQQNFTEELQLQGVGMDGKLNYQAGLYYEKSFPGGDSASGGPGLGSVCLIGAFEDISGSRCQSGTASFSYGNINFINRAAYAQATYAVTDQFKVTAGVRYTSDTAKGESHSFTNRYISTPGVFVAPTRTGCAVGFAAPDCAYSARVSSKKPTWTLNLQYNPTSDLMVYGTYSRGYRQGAVAPFSATGIPTFGPESVDNFEVGSKVSFEGAVRGHVNVALFYDVLKDKQLQVGLANSQTGANATSIYNAGKARMYGVEVDSSVRFNDVLRVDGSLSYVNSKLASINLPTSFPGYDIAFASSVKGDPLPYTPKWGLNVGPTVTLPTPETLGLIQAQAVFRYNSSFATAASNAGGVLASPVKQLDLNLDWRNVGGHPVDIAVYATNVTQQVTRGIVVPLLAQLGFNAQFFNQPPRMYGVRVKARFGS